MPPVVGAFVGIAGFLGVTGTQLAIGLLATAVRFGLSYYQSEKAKDSQKSSSAEIQQNLRQGPFPRYVVLGKARVGGTLLFWEAAEEFLYIVPILSDDIIAGVDKYYVNDIECLVDGDGYVTTPPFNSSTDEKLIRFELHHGYTSQVASQVLRDAFPGVWTTDHRAKGVAYLVAEVKQPLQANFQSVFNSAQPSIAALVRGVLAYDSRDPDHAVNKASTWSTTNNPALLLAYYLTSKNGYGLTRGLFDGDSIEAVADFCDELIQTKTKGLRKRYQMGGVYRYDEEPVDVIQKILDTFNGNISVAPSGLFAISCDELDVAEITITDDMILELEARRNTGALYEYSTIKTRFTSEDHGWLEGNEEADPWVDQTAKTRIGREIPYDFALPYVFRHDQARRLMKQKFHRLTPEWSLDLVLDFNGLELFGERVCRVVYAPLGIDGTFRVEAVSPDPEDGFAKISARLTSINPESYEWDYLTEEGTAPAVPPSTEETGTPQVPTNLGALVGNNGGTVEALFTWQAKTAGHGQKVQWKLSSDPDYTDVSVTAGDRGVLLTPLTAGVNYDARVRVTNARYGNSAWATLTFTATAVAGSTGALTSVTADGRTLKAKVTVEQAVAATAAFVDISIVKSGGGATWGSATRVPALSGVSITEYIEQPDGARDVYARSVGINGDTGAVTGPIAITVKDKPTNDGSGGSGDGGGGDGGNDNGSNYGGGGSVAPSQDDSGGGGGGGGGGGIY